MTGQGGDEQVQISSCYFLFQAFIRMKIFLEYEIAVHGVLVLQDSLRQKYLYLSFFQIFQVQISLCDFQMVLSFSGIHQDEDLLGV